jgi:hypothetical protein
MKSIWSYAKHCRLVDAYEEHLKTGADKFRFEGLTFTTDNARHTIAQQREFFESRKDKVAVASTCRPYASCLTVGQLVKILQSISPDAAVLLCVDPEMPKTDTNNQTLADGIHCINVTSIDGKDEMVLLSNSGMLLNEQNEEVKSYPPVPTFCRFRLSQNPLERLIEIYDQSGRPIGPFPFAD